MKELEKIQERTEIAEEEGFDTQQFDDLYALLGMAAVLQEENERLNDFEHSQCVKLLAANGELQEKLNQIGMTWDDSKRYARRLELERSNLKKAYKELAEDVKQNDAQNSALLLRAIAAEKENATLTKALEMAGKQIADWLGNCPLDFKDYELPNCDDKCDDQISECWKEYFIQQARSAINSKEGEKNEI